MVTKSTRRLLVILVVSVSAAVVGVAVDLLLERLAASRARVDRLEAQVLALQRSLAPEPELSRRRDELAKDVARRTMRFYAVDALTPYTFGTQVKRKLQSYGLAVSRYQIVELKGRSYLEFSLSGSARGLLLFLRDVSQQEKYWVISTVTVTTRPNGGIVDAVFRIGYETIGTSGN